MGVVGAAAQTSLGDVARIGPSRTVGPGADGIQGFIAWYKRIYYSYLLYITMANIYMYIYIVLYTLWKTYKKLLENPPIFKFGKPSISMGHLYHGYVK